MSTRPWASRAIAGVIGVALGVALSACSAASTASSASPSLSPSPSVSPPPSPTELRPASSAAASYKEYGAAACAAWEALFRAVGNPDTASGSDLSLALDKAVAAGDGAAAERLAADITKELKAGRAHVAVAGGWGPRAPAMVQFDRVFAGYEAMIAAKLAAAKHDPGAISPQAAFEAAGGAEGYFAMLDLLGRARPPAGETARTCTNIPVTMP